MKALLAAAAFVGATVFTGDGEMLEDATVVVKGERIVSVGQGARVPAGATVIDAAGGVITPGLVDAVSRLGTIEIRSEAQAIEGTGGGGLLAVNASLRVWDTFNPASILLPVARRGGITSAVLTPAGGLISGQSAWLDLVPEGERGVVRRAPLGVVVSLGAQGQEPGSRTRRLMRLRELLADVRLYRANRGPFIGNRLRDLSLDPGDLDVLTLVIERRLPLVVRVDRAAEIRTLIELARDERINLVLIGAAEGWKVRDELAKARVPVFVDPLANLPANFDLLEVRGDNALLLQSAGVDVAFYAPRGPHLVHRLRWSCGHAVARGYPRDAALAAVTSLPARILGVENHGVLRPGAVANLVVWNGDPFEVTTWPTRVLVRGHDIDLTTRQDLLTERYLTLP